MTITKREILFSIIIICFWFTVGFCISNKITEHSLESQEMYTKAYRTDSEENFLYSCDTKVGNILAYGQGIANNPVSVSELKDSYTFLKVIKEEYKKHVTYETKKDSNGKTKTVPKVRYSWDRIKTDTYNSDTVSFLGKELDISLFHFTEGSRLNLSDCLNENYLDKISFNYLYTSNKFSASVGDIRYYYLGISNNFVGTLFVNSLNDFSDSTSNFYLNQDIDSVLEYKASSIKTNIILFWVLWVFLCIVVVFVFFYFNNHWLEDKRKTHSSN